MSQWQVSCGGGHATCLGVRLDGALRDAPLVHLIGTVRETCPAGLGRHSGQRCIRAVAEGAMDLTVDYVLERKAFGETVASFQNTRFTLAQVKTETYACILLFQLCPLPMKHSSVICVIGR